jgi:hypothetical protein
MADIDFSALTEVKYNGTDLTEVVYVVGGTSTSVWTAAVYVKDSSLPASTVGRDYEALSANSTWSNADTFYLLKLSTGQLFASAMSTTPPTTGYNNANVTYYNCGYTCEYVTSTLIEWYVGEEITGTSRPDYLYAPQSTVTNPVWTLT